MIPVFLAMVASGVGIHVSGEWGLHEAWHNWAVVHVIAAVVFLILAVCHIKGHWPWFRSLARGLHKKSKPNMILSILFAFETVTGIILLAFTDGEGSHTGLWHWWGGLLMFLFGTGHLVKRWKILRTGYCRFFSRPSKN